MLRLQTESDRSSWQGPHIGDASQRVDVLASRCRVLYIKVQYNIPHPWPDSQYRWKVVLRFLGTL
jgi:hypothetical protein